MILFLKKTNTNNNININKKLSTMGVKIDTMLNNLTSSNNNIMNILDSNGLTNSIFCYHSALSISGNCRMCLVEVANRPKPIVACTAMYEPSLYVNEKSPYTKKAQEHVIEFLLLNHPLDCPICDQGGECDLQENAFKKGSDKSRFIFNKRGVNNSYLSPVIQTAFTRCIHCTRCVRFDNEVSRNGLLGMLGRSNSATIGTYSNKIKKVSNINSNIVALCPVGWINKK